MMKISIVDLEVHYRIGVSDEERARPQRLLLAVDIDFDFRRAAASDQIEKTLNYETLARELIAFGESRAWKLLEKLVADIAGHVLKRYKAKAVLVEAKKFVIPQARYVSVSLKRVRRRRAAQ